MRTIGLLALGAAALAGVGGTAAGDIVTTWNDIALNTVKGGPTPPPMASRNLAIVSAAVFDAVNSIDRQYQPYFTSTIRPATTNKDAAVIAAASTALAKLYPAQAGAINAQRSAALGGIAPGADKDVGIQLGDDMASAIFYARVSDGSGATAPPYMGGNAIGQWRPTPPGNLPGLVPLWGSVTPFAIASGSAHRPPAPPAVGTAAYRTDYEEVKSLGSVGSVTRTAEQTDIAKAWAFGGGTITPPGAWNKIAQEAATEAGLSITQNARLFAMLNIANADAAIACWDAKYFYDFWRPITAIREDDGDPLTTADGGWTSLLTTPNFPSYTSGHSTFSRASATILQAVLGTDVIDVTFQGDNPGNPGVPIVRNLTSLNAAANEAGRSRIYGGIHYEFDNVFAQQCGLSVANWVTANFFAVVPAPGAAGLLGVAGLTLLRRRR